MYGYAMSKFLPTTGFKWIDLKEFDVNNYTAIIQKFVFPKLILNVQNNYKTYTLVIH